MQIGRLFELLYILLKKESCTAKELAERFEVSTRTIYRDVETLALAGIPVYAAKGRGGGIRILPGFVLDKSLLTGSEKSEILSALHGLAAATGDGGEVLDKLAAFFQQEKQPWIAIHFAGWGGENRAFELYRGAILAKRVMRFTYHSVDGPPVTRDVEPLQLLFQDHTWYLGAYCRKRGGYRLFRLSRIREPVLLEEAFERELSPEVARSWNRPTMPDHSVTIRLRIDKSAAYRVLDEFDPEKVTELEGGSFLAEAVFPPGDWLVGFVLSYGGKARVLEPAWLAGMVKEEADKIRSLYSGR